MIVLFVMLSIGTPKEKHFVIPLNQSMFIIVSLLSGFVYYLFGGTHEPVTKMNGAFMGLSAFYLAAYFFINQWITYLLYLYVYKIRRPFFNQAMKWEGIFILMVFPVAHALYFLHNIVGIFSLLLVGIPILSAQLILKYYYMSKQMNEYLKQSVSIGHRLTERLKSNEVLDVLLKMY